MQEIFDFYDRKISKDGFSKSKVENEKEDKITVNKNEIKNVKKQKSGMPKVDVIFGIKDSL